MVHVDDAAWRGAGIRDSAEWLRWRRLIQFPASPASPADHLHRGRDHCGTHDFRTGARQRRRYRKPRPRGGEFYASDRAGHRVELCRDGQDTTHKRAVPGRQWQRPRRKCCRDECSGHVRVRHIQRGRNDHGPHDPWPSPCERNGHSESRPGDHELCIFRSQRIELRRDRQDAASAPAVPGCQWKRHGQRRCRDERNGHVRARLDLDQRFEHAERAGSVRHAGRSGGGQRPRRTRRFRFLDRRRGEYVAVRRNGHAPWRGYGQHQRPLALQSAHRIVDLGRRA